jgi:hypothetical protein
LAAVGIFFNNVGILLAVLPGVLYRNCLPQRMTLIDEA